jgi:hypothetical protein
MRFLLLALLPLTCLANPHAQEIQRALIERDRQSADFARGVASQPLPADAGRPLHPDPVIARELRPYERMRDAEAREIRFAPPVVLRKKSAADADAKPLPLPGGPRHGVEPIPATGVGG